MAAEGLCSTASPVETFKIKGIGPGAYRKTSLTVIDNSNPQSSLDEPPVVKLEAVNLSCRGGS